MREPVAVNLLAFVSKTPVVVLVLAAPLLAVEYPELRPGLWHFHRTVEDPAHPGTPMVMNYEKCTDPSADMKAMNEQLAAIGCTFSPATREGDVYRFVATCKLGGATEAVSSSQITRISDSAYEVKVDSRGLPAAAGGATHEELSAKRLGDCK